MNGGWSERDGRIGRRRDLSRGKEDGQVREEGRMVEGEEEEGRIPVVEEEMKQELIQVLQSGQLDPTSLIQTFL